MKQIDIVGRRKIWFTISIVLIVIAILASFFPGVKLDIQFSGGTIVTYSFNGDLDKGEFQSTIENSLGQKVTLREQNDVNTGRHQLRDHPQLQVGRHAGPADRGQHGAQREVPRARTSRPPASATSTRRSGATSCSNRWSRSPWPPS